MLAVFYDWFLICKIFTDLTFKGIHLIKKKNIILSFNSEENSLITYLL